MPFDWELPENENEYKEFVEKKVLPFYYSKGVSSFFTANDGTRLHWVKFVNPKNTKALIVSPGRAEPSLKYAELVYDLQDQGFDIFVIDHRGQGFSERLLTDPHKGFVQSFNDYVDDFSLLCTFVQSEKTYSKRVLLAHSMGSVVGLSYAQRNPEFFDGHVLSSPMFKISLKGLTEDIYLAMFRTMGLVGKGSDYVYNGGPGDEKEAYENNAVTTSKPRYRFARYIENEHPDLLMGSPTNHWVGEAIQASRKLYENRHIIKAPTIVFQSGDDELVDVSERNDFFDHNDKFVEKVHFDKAKHEIFQEVDAIRLGVVEKVRSFLGQI